MIRAIAFDFDGVIVESADIKTNAFREMFSDRPEHVDEIVEHHKANEGISRYHKFRHIHERILEEPYGEEIERELDERFSGLVKDAIITAPFVRGTLGMLDELVRAIPLYIVSGTPDSELGEIVSARGLGGYFKALLGSSVGKAERLREVLSAEGISAEELLFVGDALSDLEAARATGVRFVARRTPDDVCRFDGLNVAAVVGDMEGLAALMRDWQVIPGRAGDGGARA